MIYRNNFANYLTIAVAIGHFCCSVLLMCFPLKKWITLRGTSQLMILCLQCVFELLLLVFLHPLLRFPIGWRVRNHKPMLTRLGKFYPKSRSTFLSSMPSNRCPLMPVFSRMYAPLREPQMYPRGHFWQRMWVRLYQTKCLLSARTRAAPLFLVL